MGVVRSRLLELGAMSFRVAGRGKRDIVRAMKTLALGMAAVSMMVFTAAPVRAAKGGGKVKVPMTFIDKDGVGKSAGTVTLQDSKDGVTLTTDLKGLPPGEHGFHMHEKGSCDPADKDG